MGTDAGNYEQHNIGQGDGQGYFQHPARTRLAVGVNVHSSSVRPKELAFKSVSTRLCRLLQRFSQRGASWALKSWRNSVAGGSAFEQVIEVAIVVKRIRLLDVLQNSVHLFLGLAIQFFELHSYARSGVHSGDVSLGIQIAILKRKN